MIKVEDILASLLLLSHDIDKYVILVDDKVLNKKYFKYAFVNGYPMDFDKLPKWADELECGKIYELSGRNSETWCLKDGNPVDVNSLLERKFSISTKDIMSILENISKNEDGKQHKESEAKEELPL